MKDATNGIPIQEFLGLKSKMYSMIYDENENLREKKTTEIHSHNQRSYKIYKNDYISIWWQKMKYVVSRTAIREWINNF